MTKHGELVLVRHGESRWNVMDLFTGWIDVPLSSNGIREANQCSRHCERFFYDAAFTSKLARARETLLIILAKQSKTGIFQHKRGTRYHHVSEFSSVLNNTFPLITSEKLNERAYGELQGLKKDKAVKRYGADQVFRWRRGFEDKPPKGESLKDVYLRTIPYFEKEIHPRVKNGETVLVVAHGNTLRAIIKFLEKIEDDQIPFIDLPTAKPLVYECRNDKFTRIEGNFNFKRPLR